MNRPPVQTPAEPSKPAIVAPGESNPAALSAPQSYKWELLALLCGTFFLHQSDRAIFGVVLSEIVRDLHLAQSEVGLIGSTLFVVLALMMPVAGYVGDFYNRKWIIVGSLLFWSSATFCTGITTGLVGMLLLRSVATGGGESFYTPSAYPLIAAYHQRTRTLALSIHQATLYIAMMTSGFVAGYIGQHLGWRSAFFIFGSAGLVLGMILFARMRSAPVASIRGTNMSQAKVRPLEALALIFRKRTALLITIGYTALVLQFNAYVVWTPTFMREKFGLSLTQAGGLAMSCLYLASMGGVLAGGYVSDRMVRSRPGFRLELQGVAICLCAPAILIMAFSDSLVMTCIGMVALGLCQGTYQSNTPAALFDVIEPRFRSSVLGMQVMLTYLVGSASPWGVGRLREVFGDTRGVSIGFAMLAIAYLVGGLAAMIARLFTFDRDRCREPAAGLE